MPKLPSSNLLAVCVPSKGRSEIFVKKTFRIIQHSKLPWFVFVEPQDYKDYLTYVPKERLVNIKKDNQGLAYVLNFIKKWCIKNGYQFCFKLDDDTHHFYNAENLRVAPDKVQAKIMDSVVPNLLKPSLKILGDQLGAIGFPGKLFYKDYRKFTHVNKKLEGLYIIKPEEWYVPLESEGFDEESYASAHLYLRGMISLRSGMLACEHDLSKYPGGLQSFNRQEGHARTFALMEKVNPAVREILPTRVSTYSNGATFMTVNTREYNKQCAHRLPVKPGKFEPALQKKLEKLSELN